VSDPGSPAEEPVPVMPLQSGVPLPMPLPVPDMPRTPGFVVSGLGTMLLVVLFASGDIAVPVPVPVPTPPDAPEPIVPPPEVPPTPPVPLPAPPAPDDCAIADVARPMERMDAVMSFRSMKNLHCASWVIRHNLGAGPRFRSSRISFVVSQCASASGSWLRTGSMAQRGHAPFNSLDAKMFDRENVDQVAESEMMLDAADVDVNLVAADVYTHGDEVSLLALIQYRHNKQRPLPRSLVPFIG